MFRTSDYDFKLPANLIAQRPQLKRDECKMMVVHRKTKRVEHRVFKELPEYLEEGDVLVLNETKVLPARLFGKKVPGGGRVELLLLQEEQRNVWSCLIRKGKPGLNIVLEGGTSARVLDRTESGEFLVEFDCDGTLFDKLDSIGLPPLPPYIRREATEDDREYYQTVYAKKVGSVAAPTAGLHFTPSLLNDIREKGAYVIHLLLHIGRATFKPIKVKDVREHDMGAEYFELDYEAADRMNTQKELGKKIVGVGTSIVRLLETQGESGYLKPGKGWTEKFIYPPFEFKILDSMVTNFHLPKSTTLLLVSAFAGRDLVMKAYAEAVAEGYRFYSYGDAMLIV
ncbi:S-adenosylmethionine tRNA ribosyltransferase [candidate division TA06 bacterium DG_26]|uniref:S-adenosylmethionine:tRNA ribosyltransferase-isomerase n=1 Tax=candidate division TA06 bacterium DG_26 TaxID=1703771 RepID=A0A0S7WLJ0_UNCT6|nr:MAG: S-adenosylmethionine tRNA ribosyltransferase [candidate division TA06 bacterium DG_26]